MPSSEKRREERIMKIVDRCKRLNPNSPSFYDKVFYLARTIYPAMTEKTIIDYTKTVMKIIESRYSHQDIETRL